MSNDYQKCIICKSYESVIFFNEEKINLCYSCKDKYFNITNKRNIRNFLIDFKSKQKKAHQYYLNRKLKNPSTYIKKTPEEVIINKKNIKENIIKKINRIINIIRKYE